MPTRDPDLSDAPVVIVTGAARGIGRACALAMARRGFAVALTDRLAAELETTAAEVMAQGVDPLALPGDVADFAGVQARGNQVVERWGRVVALVNNAGASQPKTLIEISEEEYDRTIAVNLKGCFNWCKAVAPAMLDRKRDRKPDRRSGHQGRRARGRVVS